VCENYERFESLPPHRKLLKASLNRAKRCGNDFEKGGSEPQFFIGMKDLGMYWGRLMEESGDKKGGKK